MEDQVGELKALQDEGKIRHIGLSEVHGRRAEAAQEVAPIVSVQNRFNLGDRASQALLDHCTAEGIGFIPWRPVADHVDDSAVAGGGRGARRARRPRSRWPGCSSCSPVMLPIPGTSTVAHLEENTAAAAIELTDDELARLSQA